METKQQQSSLTLARLVMEAATRAIQASGLNTGQAKKYKYPLGGVDADGSDMYEQGMELCHEGLYLRWAYLSPGTHCFLTLANESGDTGDLETGLVFENTNLLWVSFDAPSDTWEAGGGGEDSPAAAERLVKNFLQNNADWEGKFTDRDKGLRMIVQLIETFVAYHNP